MKTPAKNGKENRFILILLAVVIAATFLVSLLFSRLVLNYKSNVALESASHLVEINNQIKLYIEDKIENDWRTTYSLCDGLKTKSTDYDDESVYAFLGSMRDIWNVSNVLVYTEDGFCIDASGQIRRNDVASSLVASAREHGGYMSIVHSTITYTVPVDTNMTLKGTRIAAVSVEQDISTFLDNMNISAFNDTACLYLTRANGIVMSRLSTPDASDTFNIATITGGSELKCLTGHEHGDDEIFASKEPVVYLMTTPDSNDYLVSTPVETRSGTMRLFYTAPEEMVNQTMDGFSQYMTTLSLIVIGGFTLLAMSAFVYIYNIRKKRFAKDLDTREKLFDMLVENTKTAFALYTKKSDEPVYTSSNARRIIGDDRFMLEKTENGFRFKNAEGKVTEPMAQLNAELKGWDGHREFQSDFLLNESAVPKQYYVIHLYPVAGSEDEIVGIAQDVTSTRDREEAVKTALTMADEANAAKTRFLSNMSHDIRTPMNAIINMTDFALECADESEKLREYLKTIRESSAHLLHLINDILDMSRIESGQTVVSTAPFKLSGMTGEVCDMMRPLCSAKRQRFAVDTSGVTCDDVCGDRLKLSQVLINLLNNAVKFTEEGGCIEFCVTQSDAARPDRRFFTFRVRDDGIGIGAGDIERVFEPFSRADDKRVNGSEGTGLGLSICRSYVNAMGGTISCKSELNQGSEFTVELCMTIAKPNGAQTAAQAVARARFDGKRALLCEDNEINYAIAKRLLEKLGFAVDVAVDGQEGLDKFAASAPGCYDIIYMDIRMPGLDGYEATRRIRQSAHPQAATIPIVAMTANVFAEDVERARVAGMNGHLGKPIMVNELISETNRVLDIKVEDK